MAKLSARGSHKVAGWRVAIPAGRVTDDHPGGLPLNTEYTTWYWKFALRSDGKVLRSLARRSTGSGHSDGYTRGGSYSIYATMTPGERDAMVARVERHLHQKFGAENVTRSAN